MDDQQNNREIVPAPQPALPVLVRGSSLIRRTLTDLKVRTGQPPFIVNSIGMKLMRIPPGQFVMGSPDDEAERDDDEGEPEEEKDDNQHSVNITKGFFMGNDLVTQAQWRAVMENNPSDIKADDLPVNTVSWDDAVAFCEKLSQKEGKRYRLPTEAEWEYAYRAGMTTTYHEGTAEDDLVTLGWDDGAIPHLVEQKKANAWGLYFIRHGYTSGEWCSDWYGVYPNGAVTDPTGPANGRFRVMRDSCCGAAYRNYFEPELQLGDAGFRVVLDLP